jgi:hypothetical protein
MLLTLVVYVDELEPLESLNHLWRDKVADVPNHIGRSTKP